MNYVRMILKQNFATQIELARHLGISRSHLGKLINGRQKMTVTTIKFLSQGLERIDGQTWLVHANHIRAEENKTPVTLQIIGGYHESR